MNHNRIPSPFDALPSSRAEVVVDELQAEHERIAIDLERDDEKAPTWFAHVPGMDPFPIRLIGVWRTFVKFTGFGADETNCDYILVQPDNVVISIVTLSKPEESKPFLGFQTTELPAAPTAA
jgi:hypothetical protein